MAQVIEASHHGGHIRRGGRRPPVVDAGPYRRSLDPDLAARIDLARRRAGLTFRHLALATGMSPSMVHAVCRGSRVPCREYATAMAAVLDLDDEVAEELLQSAVVRAWQ